MNRKTYSTFLWTYINCSIWSVHLVVAWLRSSMLVSINVVTLHRTLLVLGRLTVYRWVNNLGYLDSHLSRFSPLPSVGL